MICCMQADARVDVKMQSNTPEIGQDEEPTPETDPFRPPDLLYSVEEVPPWYLCILLGFQVHLETYSIPYILFILFFRNILCI